MHGHSCVFFKFTFVINLHDLFLLHYETMFYVWSFRIVCFQNIQLELKFFKLVFN